MYAELYQLFKNPPTLKVWHRFINKIKRDGDGQCWNWQASQDEWGYGCFRLDGRMRKAHRQICKWLYGDLGVLVVDHVVCDNPSCCNPLHLIPTTQKQNMRRSTKIGGAINARKTHCKYGHELTESNLMPSYMRRGKRHCKLCRNRIVREYRQRRKEALLISGTAFYKRDSLSRN